MDDRAIAATLRNSPSNVPPIVGMAAVELLVRPRSFPEFQSAFNQLTKWIASEICRGWEVWDPNLKKTTLSYPWRYPLYNVTVRLSETAHASDFPSAAIQQLCTASLLHLLHLLHPAPSLGAPTPKLSSRARPQKRQAERWVDLMWNRHEQTGSSRVVSKSES